MADMNSVQIIGRLTRDAELKYTNGGMAIASFSIAVNRRKKNGEQWVEEASFFEVNLFGKSAENLKAYLLKGKQVAVLGELRQDRWEQDGQQRSKVIIAAISVQLLGGNTSEGHSSGQGGQGAGKPSSRGANTSRYMPSDEPAEGAFPEEIPF